MAKGQTYGLSARGVAVNTAEQEGEEFPWFREFWIEKPAKGQKKLTVYALLDSESLAGAYAFTIIPGRATVMSSSLHCISLKLYDEEKRMLVSFKQAHQREATKA